MKSCSKPHLQLYLGDYYAINNLFQWLKEMWLKQPEEKNLPKSLASVLKSHKFWQSSLNLTDLPNSSNTETKTTGDDSFCPGLVV